MPSRKPRTFTFRRLSLRLDTLIHNCDPDKYKPGEIVEILPPDPNPSPEWRMAVNNLRMEILQKKTGWRPQG